MRPGSENPVTTVQTEQLPYPALADTNPLRRLSLRDVSVPSLFQPIQLISFLLAHPDSFHPSALWLSRGTLHP